ncbi:hypothetical protein NL108_006154 [Boleophthalmus pectinirostris]|nr:hypothetical protein NL108_006154 [Boleophthalmus pectinirostris]
MKASREINIRVTTLSCLSGAREFPELNSIDDLKNNYDYRENPFPKHGFGLLQALAYSVNIDNDDNVNPDETYYPEQHFGSHPYNNEENLLDPVPEGCTYCTMGNHTSNDTDPIMNRARIILCVNETSCQIHQVYFTQHYKWDESRPQNTEYDPNHTYKISPQLLKELRTFSFDEWKEKWMKWFPEEVEEPVQAEHRE